MPKYAPVECPLCGEWKCVREQADEVRLRPHERDGELCPMAEIPVPSVLLRAVALHAFHTQTVTRTEADELRVGRGRQFDQ